MADKATRLHEDATIIDGLIVSKWGPDIFAAMRAGGLTAANCTCSIWGGFDEAMRAIAIWKGWFREHAALIRQVRDVADIAAAKRERRTGIILGWQNSTGFAEFLPFVPVFHELGLRVVQLTYHTANMTGGGCLESRDGGLTDFGHDLVAELNRVGILIDLSHVGATTSRDAILASKQPAAYTHCAPRALKDHGRNKTDEELRFIAERGGMIGVTMFPPFMPRGNDSSLDDYLDAIEHTIRIAGEDQVGIGTDFTQGQGQEAFDYYTRDKGTGRMLLPRLGSVTFPDGFGSIQEFPNLTRAMERRGWAATRIRKVMGGNWVRMFGEVWRQQPDS